MARRRPLTKAQRKAKYRNRAAKLKHKPVSPTELLAEGIKEIGRIGSIGYVLTQKRLQLMHADWLSPSKTERVMPDDLVVVAMDVS